MQRTSQKSTLILTLVVIGSVAAVFLNLVSMLSGTQNITLYFLFYIPIILIAFFYPRRGILSSVGYAGVFLFMVIVTSHESPQIVIESLGHAGIFILIGLAISYLTISFSPEQKIHIRLAEIVESSNDAIIGKTLDGRIIYWNKGAEHLYGYTAADALGRPITVLLPMDQPDDIKFLMQKIRNGDSIERYETQRMTRDGRRIHVSLSISPIKNDRGKIIGASTIAHDITERKQIENALGESERRYRELIELLPQTVFEIDQHGMITSANSMALNTFGYTREDLERGVMVTRVFHPDDHGRLRENIQRVLQGEHLGGTGYTPMRKDGTTFPAIVYSNAILHENIPVGLRGILIDITELRKAQEAQETANKKLQLLNSITRHDILNQITILNIYHNLAESAIDNPNTISYLGIAKKAANTIAHQIEFTREYQDIGIKTPTWQNVHGLFLHAAAIFSATKIDIVPWEKKIEIYADPLLEKVFSNLIDNSLRYGEKLTGIRCSHREDDDGLTLVYEDDGVGISIEDKSRLFNKGFGKHTGLGLFLAREILAITGIVISEQGEPGKGARFEMKIPRGMYRFTDA